MKQPTACERAQPLIAIHLSGQRHSALLLSLSESGAKVQLLARHQMWLGRSIALSIADLPTFIGNIRVIEDDQIEIVFRTPIDASVVKYALIASGGSPADDS